MSAYATVMLEKKDVWRGRGIWQTSIHSPRIDLHTVLLYHTKSGGRVDDDTRAFNSCQRERALLLLVIIVLSAPTMPYPLSWAKKAFLSVQVYDDIDIGNSSVGVRFLRVNFSKKKAGWCMDKIWALSFSSPLLFTCGEATQVYGS